MVAYMTFGKHKGEPIANIDSGYLAWLLSLKNLEPWLREAVQAELASRPVEDRRAGRRDRQGDERGTVAVGPVLKRWYSEMALRFHPDRGGSDAEMQAINHAYERLKELIGATNHGAR